MMNLDLQYFRNLAIIMIFAVLFGTAAFDKFKTLKTPEWFLKQFENTFIAKLPGGVSLGYWGIATAELLVTILLLASIVITPLLPIALTCALFVFAKLCFGLRLVSDFQGSANMFIYFTATLISLFVIS